MVDLIYINKNLYSDVKTFGFKWEQDLYYGNMYLYLNSVGACCYKAEYEVLLSQRFGYK